MLTHSAPYRVAVGHYIVRLDAKITSILHNFAEWT